MPPADADDEYDPLPPRRWPGWGAPVLAVLLVGGAALGVLGWQQNRQRDEARRAELVARLEAEAAAEAAARRRADPTGAGLALGPLLPLVATPADPGPVVERLRKELVGVWAGAGREVEYRADGTYRDGDLSGTWKPAGLTGTRVLTVERTGGGPARVRVTFEGGELLHDGPEPGAVDVLRRKR